ncbi:Bug family tripartite tricarboxylate transporter substrate binding protein [Plastoroseomonas hellenica]|uniref:Bug family tripartite tricarboxylate transporter substrate binding protein n=1 Tax=Plastoroseomonas hellenica TaxID=2687306 RepID=UPI001BACA744|nr:tripartite tricarboxylate transporter substrate-binding protein [Plastoroseomonas hellenica]MBR0646015.1 tripartite tricarboxylate transporter substrate binding protein [Plastoroseomonas hellenica]
MNALSRRAALGLLATAPLARPALAQAPRPVRLIVGFAPGGSVDTLARTLQPHLTEVLGQPVLVENQGGANTLLATRAVAAAAPDGQTLLVTSDSLSINQALLPDPGYSATASFAPVTLAIAAAQILVTHPGSGIRNAAEYAARLRDGRLNIGVPGWGAIGHLVSESLNQRLGGSRAEHVAYRGGAPATTDLLAGNLDAVWITLPAVTPHVRDGRLLGLAVSTGERSRALPAVPTVAETLSPGFDVPTWQGILAPAGTPRPVIERLSAAAIAVLRRPAVNQALDGLGFDVVAGPPEQFSRHIEAAVASFTPVIRAAGIRPEGA